jgi:hypothetical protein
LGVGVLEWRGDGGLGRAGRPKTERGACRKGKQGWWECERLAERIKYRYDNHNDQGFGADPADARRRPVAPDALLGRKLLCGEVSK